MKKTLLLALLLAAGFGANAQEGGLADGSQAPDFTATDLNGTEHNLQTYLDQGKTVVLYISATWCGPCWQFHNTHYLEQVYESFGTPGSKDVVILYVEGDPTTTIGDLNGIPSANGSTQGDWVTGTPYPIIDSALIAGSTKYDIDFFPTIYRICPSGVEGQQGTTTQIARGTPSELVTRMEADCHDFTPAANYVEVEAGDLRFCDATGTFTANILNRGAEITTATGTLKKDGEVIATQIFENLALDIFESGVLKFDDVTVDAEADYQIELTNANGSGTFFENATAATEDFQATPNASVPSNKNIIVTVHTDKYPAEMSWKIINSAGVAVHTQTYANLPTNKNTTKTHLLTLDANECYGVQLIDAYGDGWVDGTTGVYGMTIQTPGTETPLFTSDGVIGKGTFTMAVFKTNDVLDNTKFETNTFAVYPNPSNGVFNFTTIEAIDVTVLDITGKTVYTATGINDGGSIDLSSLQSGMYIAKIKGETTDRVEKLVIK